MQLQPYIYFYGRCEEALEFYKAVFGGTYELQRHADAPTADRVSPDFRHKVMHAAFKGAGIAFMASDGREAKAIDPQAGNISLSLIATDRSEGERVFKALSEGGDVIVPYGDAFWGGKFGMLHDRLGTEWLITAS